MLLLLADRVQETTATTGTGTITLGGAASGYQSFASAFPAGGVVPYVIVSGSAWECGTGTYTVSGTTLSRAPTSSSSSGAAISLSGTSTVFCSGIAALLAKLQARVFSEASNSTPTPNSDLYDIHIETALATAPTIAAPTGSPSEGQPLFIFLTDNGTARALSWNSAYAATTVVLPTTTVAGVRIRVSFVYNSTSGKWDCIGVA
jgi:hypothetical protein